MNPDLDSFTHITAKWIRISVLFIFQQLWTRHYIIGESFHNPSSHKGSFIFPHFHQFLMGTVLVTYCALKKRIGLHLHFQLQKTERRYHPYLNFILDFLNIKIWHFLQKSLHCCHTLLKILKSGQPWTVRKHAPLKNLKSVNVNIFLRFHFHKKQKVDCHFYHYIHFLQVWTKSVRKKWSQESVLWIRNYFFFFRIRILPWP